AISTPPFTLTGGLPLGGEYTGPGVANGIFNPAAAGLGMHTITYTYTDINLCSNSAIDSIGVTQYTGIVNQADQSAVNIYPNPNNGNFKVKFNLEGNDIINLIIYNTLRKVVFEENNISVGQTFSKDITLNDFTKGVYYLHIEGKRTNLIKKLVIQ
ncbi:MAG: T9SS type A sorting domain-containing protein, partial [Bacteroidales bacterium]|nr:T9SS type A sorting domain-containing protein [Bacteroidales bacterium]